MRKVFCWLLALSLLLSGCATAPVAETKRYTATFLDLFDTVTTILGPGTSEEAFRAQAQKIHDELLIYHQLFDIYNDYEGVAIECQNYPDAPNKADYPCCVLRPGEVYEQAIIFAFGVR